MEIICINEEFTVLPQSHLGRELPKFGQTYTISYQLMENGVLLVELKEIPGLLFEMGKHFLLLETQGLSVE